MKKLRILLAGGLTQDKFEKKIKELEEILKKDPTQIYSKMDYKTRIYYRNTIKKMAKKTEISEIYVAQKALELAEREFNKENKNTILVRKKYK